MSRTAIPSTFPEEGIYQYSNIHVDLSCATPGAKIYYTLDGNEPTPDSAVYQRDQGLLLLPTVSEREMTHTIRAFAQAEGMETSRTVTFTYRMIARRRGVYHHQLLREPTADTAGLICIQDFDLDKMYLVIGNKRAVLIDGYQGR